jgi:hypothetical protein
MSDLNAFARRYIAMWNEPDADLRRKVIAELFAPDAAHYTPSQEIHGHAKLEARITTAYEKWVKPGLYAFRAVPNANGHHNMAWLTDRDDGRVGVGTARGEHIVYTPTRRAGPARCR